MIDLELWYQLQEIGQRPQDRLNPCQDRPDPSHDRPDPSHDRPNPPLEYT